MLKHIARHATCFAVASLLAGAAMVPTAAQAQGDLLVAPTRVILDGRRGAQVILSNIGTEEATYRIELVLRRMGPDGNLVEVSNEEANALEQAALSMVRYAPRRIKLPPGQPQSVRIAARPTTDLPDGEYRVHLSFKAIPKPRPAVSDGAPVEGLSVKLIPIYGVTIPLIVRHGQVEARAALQDLRVMQTGNGRPVLTFAIDRSGDASTFGDLVAIPSRGEPMFLARGVAVYTELDRRMVTVVLNEEQEAALRGPVRLEYREPPERGGEVIASIEANLG